MSRPIIREHNVTTNEIVDREMTGEEFAAYEAQMLKDAEEAQALADKQAAKEAAQSKLESLGLTADDLKALGL